MKRLRLPLVVGLALASLVAQAQEPRVTVIAGATLIDGTMRPPIQDAVIVIDGARIRQAGARSAVAVPPGATAIFNPSISLKDFAAMNKAGLQPPRF